MTDRPKTLEDLVAGPSERAAFWFGRNGIDFTLEQHASLTALLRSVSEEAERRGMERAARRALWGTRYAHTHGCGYNDGRCNCAVRDLRDELHDILAASTKTPPPGGEEPREGSSPTNQPGGATDSEPRPSEPATQAGGRGDLSGGDGDGS